MSGNTFTTLLDWKMRHFKTPVTSTPKKQPSVQTVTQRDIQTCFGFDDSEEENNSGLISPIVSIQKKPQPKFQKLKLPEVPNVLQVNNSDIKNKEENPSTVTQEKKDLKNSKIKEVKKKPIKIAPAINCRPSRKAKNKNSESASTRKSKEETKPETAPRLFEDKLSQGSQEDDTSRVQHVSDTEVEHDIYIKGNDRDVGKGFNALLVRYGKVAQEDEDDECLVHFESKNTKKTYAPRKSNSQKLAFKQTKRLKKKSIGKRKSTISTRNKKPIKVTDDEDDSDMDLETKNWLEQKNKEFDDVLHVPLIVKNSK